MSPFQLFLYITAIGAGLLAIASMGLVAHFFWSAYKGWLSK